MGCGKSKEQEKKIDERQEGNVPNFNGPYTQGTENIAFETDIGVQVDTLQPATNLVHPQPRPRTSLATTALIEEIKFEEIPGSNEVEKPRQSYDENQAQTEVVYLELEAPPQEKLLEDYLEPIKLESLPQKEEIFEEYLVEKVKYIPEVQVEDYTEPNVEVEIPSNSDERKAHRMAIVLQERMNLERIRRQAKEKAEEDSKREPVRGRRRTTLVGIGNPSPIVPAPVPWAQRRHTQPIMKGDLPAVTGSLKRTHSQVMVDLNSLLKKKLNGKEEHDKAPVVAAPALQTSNIFLFGPLAESIPEGNDGELIVKEKKIIPEPRGEYSKVRTKLMKELTLVLKPVEDQEIEYASFSVSLEPVPELKPLGIYSDEEEKRMNDEFQHHTSLMREGPVVDFEVENGEQEAIGMIEKHHATAIQDEPALNFNLQEEDQTLYSHLMRERPEIDFKMGGESKNEEDQNNIPLLEEGVVINIKLDDEDYSQEQDKESSHQAPLVHPLELAPLAPLIQEGSIDSFNSIELEFNNADLKFDETKVAQNQAHLMHEAAVINWNKDLKVTDDRTPAMYQSLPPKQVEEIIDLKLGVDQDCELIENDSASFIQDTEHHEDEQLPKNIDEKKQEQLKAEGIQFYMEGRSYERALHILTAGTKYQLAAEKFTQIGSIELVLSSIVALIRVEMYDYAKKAIDKSKKRFPDDLALIEALESTIPYYSEQHVYANADSVSVVPRFTPDGVPKKRERRIPTKFSI